MQEAWRAYLELALGLTEASKKKAMKVARKLVAESGSKAGQAQAIAEELISTSLANREAVGKLVRYELDRALGRVGLATAEEVAELTERVQDLERKLRAAEAAAASPEPAPFVKKAPAKKAAAGKAPAEKAPAQKKAVKKAAASAAPAKKVVAKKVVKKAAAKKAAE
ncbi:phasin family protein [Longispora albida]|uniref:phasin family protein n=1 Tax=Longispora albida TaxID=203523 RepID=UPI0003603CE3|nr:hypothetical protein [Longispora albida]